MSNYDDYFTNDDKPFAENLNDALLLSNVFDMTVPIILPTMFKNKQWVNTTSPRKAGVSIITLKEQLPSGVSVGTVSNNSVLTGTGTVKLGFYPNFNSFGKIKFINWTSSGSLTINLKTVNGSVIASNISKGTISSQLTDLMTLQEIVIEIVMSSATLNSLEIVMENKSSERYGAEVAISEVNGLQTSLDGKVDKVTGKGLSTNDFTNAYKDTVNNLKPVATSGSYNDLTNKPTIPTKTGDLTNNGDGTTGVTYVKSNDARLTDSRSPTPHSHTISEITDFSDALAWDTVASFNYNGQIYNILGNAIFCCLECIINISSISSGLNNIVSLDDSYNEFLPAVGVQADVPADGSLAVYIDSYGRIGVINKTSNTQSNKNVKFNLIWRRQ